MPTRTPLRAPTRNEVLKGLLLGAVLCPLVIAVLPDRPAEQSSASTGPKSVTTMSDSAPASADTPPATVPNEVPVSATVQLKVDQLDVHQRNAFCYSLANHLSEQARFALEGRASPYSMDQALPLLNRSTFYGALLATAEQSSTTSPDFQHAVFMAGFDIWPLINEMPGTEIEVSILWEQCERSVDKLVQAGGISLAGVRLATSTADSIQALAARKYGLRLAPR